MLTRPTGISYSPLPLLSSPEQQIRWVFEKYDGVRGFWNPEKKAFYSRFGKSLIFPEEIISAMPNIFLDGELWYGTLLLCKCTTSLTIRNTQRFGRDNFQEAMKIAHRMDVTEIDWAKFRYMVFDLPKAHGAYEERYSALGNLCPQLPSGPHFR